MEFDVAGRGLMHLGILLENMRREGYEMTVGKPNVIYHYKDGKRLEPIEMLVLDIPTEMMGPAMQWLLGDRLAEMIRMDTHSTRTTLEFTIPARGLIGLRNRMLTATKGEAIMHHRFARYDGCRRNSRPLQRRDGRHRHRPGDRMGWTGWPTAATCSSNRPTRFTRARSSASTARTVTFRSTSSSRSR